MIRLKRQAAADRNRLIDKNGGIGTGPFQPDRPVHEGAQEYDGWRG